MDFYLKNRLPNRGKKGTFVIRILTFWGDKIAWMSL